MNSQLQIEFIQTVDQYQGIINKLCCLYYPNLEDQKDARQDVVLQLWKSFPNFRGESSKSTWIYRVALNTILAKIRNQKRRIVTTNMDYLTGNERGKLVGLDDDLQLLHFVIESLHGQDKAMVILYLEGYKNKEIATILSISPSNVSSRLHRIKTKLKDQFQKLNHVTR